MRRDNFRHASITGEGRFSHCLQHKAPGSLSPGQRSAEANVEPVRDYIVRQEEHHRTMSFQDEFRALCRKHGIEIDERYVWD